MNAVTSQLLYFYDRHPISRDIIIAKLQASRGHLDNLRPEELSPHDQDHYGGLKATDELVGKLRSAQERSSPTFAPVWAGPCVTLPISTAPMSLESNSHLCVSQAHRI
jgi:hypothetical protein